MYNHKSSMDMQSGEFFRRYEKLNQELVPLGEGQDPISGLINPDYKQQLGNSRKCVECGKIHDTIVENTMTGERIKEIHKCKDCFFQWGGATGCMT